MRINTNSIGNYFTQQTRNSSNVARSENIQKTTSTKNIAQPISVKEKQMFAKMYPEKKSEIMDYHYYQKNGKMSGVTIGSLLDRRG